MTADEAISLVDARFEEALRGLAERKRSRASSTMQVAAEAIRRQASKSWRLEIGEFERPYSISTAQLIVRFDRKYMGRVFAAALQEVRLTRDTALRAILDRIDPALLDHVLTDELIKLFLAHEFLHISQQLGSSQYHDSDYYVTVVTAVDYQADLVAIWYVRSALMRPMGLDRRSHLVLLIAIHIAVVNAYAGDEEEMPRENFDRLMVWYLQLARVVGSGKEPSLEHPSFQKMPILAFPRFDGALAGKVSEARLAAPLNDVPEIYHDVVMAISDGFGLLRILRFASTERGRIPEIVTGVLRKDLSAVREALEELRVYHGAALDFEGGDVTRSAIEELSGEADTLVFGVSDRLLDINDKELIGFFDRAERLVYQKSPRLKGDGVADLRACWASGAVSTIRASIERMFGVDWKMNGRDQEVSSFIRDEILRVANRLSWSLDELLGE